MSKYETFATEADATQRISEMAGWYGPHGDGPEAVQYYLPDDPNADAEGNVWVIEAAAGKLLHADGFIR